jgi:hypothetical protein
MVHNKIVLLGDAVFISRPQTTVDAAFISRPQTTVDAAFISRPQTADDALANVKTDDKFK